MRQNYYIFIVVFVSFIFFGWCNNINDDDYIISFINNNLHNKYILSLFISHIKDIIKYYDYNIYYYNKYYELLHYYIEYLFNKNNDNELMFYSNLALGIIYHDIMSYETDNIIYKIDIMNNIKEFVNF